MGPRQLFSISVTQWLQVLSVRSGCVCHNVVLCDIPNRGKPLLRCGSDSCFPLVSHSACRCWVYVVVVFAHKVVLCDNPYRGKPLLTWGPDSCFPLVSHSGCRYWVYVVVVFAHKIVLCDIPYRGCIIYKIQLHLSVFYQKYNYTG